MPAALPRVPDGRVLFIGGWGRCGSTLLDMMLGQVCNVVSAGELREIWLRGCVENRPCSCGAPFWECPFWRDVGEHAFGGWDHLDLLSILQTRYALDRPWGMPAVLLRPATARGSAAMEQYTDALSRIFAAIRTVSGCDLVIDSSKIVSHALLLSRTPGVDMRVVSLVRDSRGVAYSASKRVEKPITGRPPTLLPRHGPVGAAGRYAFHNGGTASLRMMGVPYLTLRYEDMVADPARGLREVLAHAGETGEPDLSFVHGNCIDLAENHLVDGNPVRFTKGSLRLRVDDVWRSQMPRRQRRIVTALTLPLLAAYGYPVHVGDRSGP
jgi:hypothetical protein